MVPYHLGPELFAERGAELAALAAHIAREVADNADHPVQVAGSLPPLFGSYEPWNFNPDAALFNCSQPERFEPAVRELRDALGDDAMPIGAYANAFEDKEEGYASNGVILEHRHDLTPDAYAAMAQRWVDAGATIIGGCCGIRPDHIAALATMHPQH